ncbi:hypothetical protein ACLOJK_005956 [Asimina triloba]
MSSTRRTILRPPVVVNVGCGCRRTRLSNIFNPKPKNKPSQHRTYSHYTTSWEKARLSTNETSFYDDDGDGSSCYYKDSCPKNPNTVKASGRVGESIAVVKDSDDPYLDFRRSMLQMILEKEIYGRDDLRQLLDCFLSLNSPYHHEIIVQAFTEIWNGVYSAPPGKMQGGGGLSGSRDRRRRLPRARHM